MPRGYRLYLAHAAAGDGFDSACIDAGDTASANVSFPEWSALSTRTDLVDDVGALDPGSHYVEDASHCIGDDAVGDLDANGICDDLD